MEVPVSDFRVNEYIYYRGDTSDHIRFSSGYVGLVTNSAERLTVTDTLVTMGSTNLTVVGNVTATRYYGDGSQLTGISTTDTNCTAEGSCPLIGYLTNLDNSTVVRQHNTSWITSNQLTWNGTDVSLAWANFTDQLSADKNVTVQDGHHFSSEGAPTGLYYNGSGWVLGG